MLSYSDSVALQKCVSQVLDSFFSLGVWLNIEDFGGTHRSMAWNGTVELQCLRIQDKGLTNFPAL